ncbi:protocatechuate 3,4-dioxygenase subunit alpha [Allorhizocola rhizosphaerae]|uniref:protocatechuate 3,4-dioxygenase subunit alpha n=1 Tax=Allorhizocola rhizosphaerae TaxID=1872709 RepID=UPI000E3DA0C5|nr:protocatechuate 3,4-dioxygenase subunit alpha [Allorhizocola rhizosphaerae]
MTTPSQTVGPFFPQALVGKDGPLVVPLGTPGAVWIRGRVFDGADQPVPGVLIESWQTEGFGRTLTDAQGAWALHTVKAPYVVLSIAASGLLDRLVARVHFEEPQLAGVDPDRLHTLVARATDDGYAFDIHLQGPHETVFFAV